MAVDHALEDILQLGVGLDAVELRGLDQRATTAQRSRAAVGTREQMVLAPERNGPDGALDRVVVELDAAVVEEPAQRRSSARGRSGSPRRARCAPRRGASWSSSQVFSASTSGRDCSVAAQLALVRRLSRGSPPRSHRARRSGAAPRPRSATRSPARPRRTCAAYGPSRRPARLSPLRGQPLEPGIAVDLQHAAEPARCAAGRSALRSGAVEVDGGRRLGSAPRPVSRA